VFYHMPSSFLWARKMWKCQACVLKPSAPIMWKYLFKLELASTYLQIDPGINVLFAEKTAFLKFRIKVKIFLNFAVLQPSFSHSPNPAFLSSNDLNLNFLNTCLFVYWLQYNILVTQIQPASQPPCVYFCTNTFY
jgi:hypothetical protein